MVSSIRSRRFLRFLPIFAPSKGGQLVLSQAGCCLSLPGLGKRSCNWGGTLEALPLGFPSGFSYGKSSQIQDVDGKPGRIRQDNSMVNLNYQVLPAGLLGNVRKRSQVVPGNCGVAQNVAKKSCWEVLGYLAILLS